VGWHTRGLVEALDIAVLARDSICVLLTFLETIMGGPSISHDPFDMARAITEKQLLIAKQLQGQHFNGQNSPELLGAIIQAVALNYSAYVSNK
jgi:hypothetical protein